MIKEAKEGMTTMLHQIETYQQRDTNYKKRTKWK